MLMLLPSGFSVSDQTSVWWLEALVNWRGEVSAAEDQLESVCGSQRSGFKHNDALIVSSLKGLWHQLKQILKRAWTQHNFWSAGRNVSTTSHQGRGGFYRERIVAFIISFTLINVIEHMLPFLSLAPRVLLSTSKAVHCGTFVSSTLSGQVQSVESQVRSDWIWTAWKKRG